MFVVKAKSDFAANRTEYLYDAMKRVYLFEFMELANLLEVKIPPRYEPLDLSNCLEVFKLTEMKKKAMLHKTQDFLNLPVSTVIEILKSDDLNVPSEEDVFNSVKLWVNCDEASRKNELAQLMSSVRLTILSIEFLVKEVLHFCDSRLECVTSLIESFIRRETPRRKKEKNSTGWRMAKTIDIYDGENWTLSKEIGINKIRFASVIVGDRIVMISGIDISTWDMLTSKHSLKPLYEARSDFPEVTLRRDSSTDVYVIVGDGPTISVERWNSKTGDWEIIAPLLTGLCYHCASAIGDNIYVTGGRKFEERKIISSNIVQMYSVESNSWTCRAQMIQGRSSHSSAIFKGKLLIAGGYNYQIDTNLNSVEHYDSIANLWTEFTQLPKPASGISLCCYQNQILSIVLIILNYSYSNLFELLLT
ncbi:kelch repeat and BTB domain-containing protein 12-like [Arctopsyche grandis]|uniref:kelch repeat and BTB domain-containing protein 12-like n=1 Tax=Arctopsyche grandis TaxID=121162 RepID=UPI00406D689B